MPTRSPDERARARAEARRRAKLAERGELPGDDPAPAEREAVSESRGLLQRLFPSAPPLPNRPDPLQRFDASGPFRPVRERIYLLRQNLLAWFVPSLPCSLGYYAASTPDQLTSMIGTFLTFGSLIAAGWIGWQRPSLYGTVTALIAVALVWAVVVLAFAANTGISAFAGGGNLLVTIVMQALLQGALGFIAGWYGGYLRRRQAQVGAQTRQTAAARRRR